MTALHPAALFSVFIAIWKCSFNHAKCFLLAFGFAKVPPALTEMFTGARSQTCGVQKLHEIKCS